MNVDVAAETARIVAVAVGLGIWWDATYRCSHGSEVDGHAGVPCQSKS